MGISFSCSAGAHDQGGGGDSRHELTAGSAATPDNLSCMSRAKRKGVKSIMSKMNSPSDDSVSFESLRIV